MTKKRIIKTELYRLTDKGKELISKNEYTEADLKEIRKNPPVPQFIKDLHKAQERKNEMFGLAFGDLYHIRKSVGEIYDPINEAVGNLTTPINSIKKILEPYNKARELFYNDLAAVAENPVITTLKYLESSTREFSKSKERVENEIYYQLTEAELKEKTTEVEEQKKELERLREQVKKDAEKVKLATFIIENSKKPAPPKPPKPLTLKPNFTDAEFQIKTLHDNSKFMFVATLEQWQNLFSDEIKPFPVPIELRRGVTLAMLREFINGLIGYKVISKRGTLNTLEKVNVFSFDNSKVTAKQLSDAQKTIDGAFYTKSNKIQSIFTEMRL